MYSYRKDPNCQLYYWGVDIQDDDGFLCRGIIREWKPRNGLMIDFLCEGSELVFVKLNKIIGVTKVCQHRRAFQADDLVETIIQRTPIQRWRWYPSRVISTSVYGPNSYLYLEIQYGEKSQREIMIADRVRFSRTPPLEQCPYCPDVQIQIISGIRGLNKPLHEYRTILPLDEDLLAVTTREGFLRKCELDLHITGAKLDGRELVYLSHSIRRVSEEKLRLSLWRIVGTYDKITVLVDKPFTELEQFAVSRDIQFCILSYVEIRDRVRYQRVCVLWSLLNTSQLICVNLTKHNCVHFRLINQLMITLQKGVTEQTKFLVLFGHDVTDNVGIIEAASMLSILGYTFSVVVLYECVAISRDDWGKFRGYHQEQLSSAYLKLAGVSKQLFRSQAMIDVGSESRKISHFNDGKWNKWICQSDRKVNKLIKRHIDNEDGVVNKTARFYEDNY